MSIVVGAFKREWGVAKKVLVGGSILSGVALAIIGKLVLGGRVGQALFYAGSGLGGMGLILATIKLICPSYMQAILKDLSANRMTPKERAEHARVIYKIVERRAEILKTTFESAYQDFVKIPDAKRACMISVVGTRKVQPSAQEIEDSKRTACHQIIGDIYLGNSKAFMETTGFDCSFVEPGGMIPKSLDTSNPQKFTFVITLCPLRGVVGDFPDFDGYTTEKFRRSFLGSGISWHYVGKTTGDHPSFWDALVHDCTYPKSEKARVEFPLTEQQSDTLCTEKSTLLRQHATVEEYFEPIFAEIDRGMLGQKKVLVHCQAGKSRSASVLAAYLINRLGVSSQEAINFLKSKRLCVDPKFAPQLKAYEQTLFQARARQHNTLYTKPLQSRNS